jgi:hypothetical protein
MVIATNRAGECEVYQSRAPAGLPNPDRDQLPTQPMHYTICPLHHHINQSRWQSISKKIIEAIRIWSVSHPSGSANLVAVQASTSKGFTQIILHLIRYNFN